MRVHAVPAAISVAFDWADRRNDFAAEIDELYR
jgi:hypothetical protein